MTRQTRPTHPRRRATAVFPLLVLAMACAQPASGAQAQPTPGSAMQDMPDKARTDRSGQSSINNHSERVQRKPASDYNNAPYLQDHQALGDTARKSRLSHGKSPTSEEYIPPGMNAPDVQRNPAQPPPD